MFFFACPVSSYEVYTSPRTPLSTPGTWDNTLDYLLDFAGYYVGTDYDQYGRVYDKYVTITRNHDGTSYTWRGNGGEWTLYPHEAYQLRVGKDCPYYQEGYRYAVFSTDGVYGPRNVFYRKEVCVDRWTSCKRQYCNQNSQPMEECALTCGVCVPSADDPPSYDQSPKQYGVDFRGKYCTDDKFPTPSSRIEFEEKLKHQIASYLQIQYSMIHSFVMRCEHTLAVMFEIVIPSYYSYEIYRVIEERIRNLPNSINVKFPGEEDDEKKDDGKLSRTTLALIAISALVVFAFVVGIVIYIERAKRTIQRRQNSTALKGNQVEPVNETIFQQEEPRKISNQAPNSSQQPSQQQTQQAHTTQESSAQRQSIPYQQTPLQSSAPNQEQQQRQSIPFQQGPQQSNVPFQDQPQRQSIPYQQAPQQAQVYQNQQAQPVYQQPQQPMYHQPQEYPGMSLQEQPPPAYTGMPISDDTARGSSDSPPGIVTARQPDFPPITIQNIINSTQKK